VDEVVELTAIARRYDRPVSILRRVMRYRATAVADWRSHAVLVLAVCAVESGGRPDVYTPAGGGVWSAGLMQVASQNWPSQGLDWESAVDPMRNLRAGVAILKADVQRFGEWDGLQAYNGGPGAIGSDPGYAAAVWAWVPVLRAALRSPG